jgi:perosamine synthetase
MMRHVPPTAVPVHLRDLWHGLRALGNPQGALREFEEAVSAYIGASHCYLTSSGRAGLYLILRALRRLSDRTHVIVPAYTCPTVPQAVLKAGLRVRLCDLSLDTLGLDREALARLIDDRVLAIIAVHPFGLPEDMADLVALGRRDGIFVIEDAAQSLGARLDGRMIGSWGDVGLFSLGRGKAMTTGGGGIVVTSNELCAAAVRDAIASESSLSPKAGLGTLAFLAGYRLAMHPVGWWFIVQTPLNPADESQSLPPPFSVSPLSTCQMGVGLSMLALMDEINQVRQRNAERMMAALGELALVRLPTLVPNATPIYLRLPVLVADNESREWLFWRLHQNGIGVSRMYERPLAELFADQIDQNGAEFPAAKHVYDHLLTLPTHHQVTEQDLTKARDIFYERLAH